jgi:acarbose 7IV-phosphotransferase
VLIILDLSTLARGPVFGVNYNESLPCSPETWVRQVMGRYSAEIVAVGLGPDGVLLGVRGDNFLERMQAYRTRPIVNTIGAGDALFSAFLHGYLACGNPYRAMQKALLFAAHKIGVTSASEGYLDEKTLNDLYDNYTSTPEATR